MNTLSQRTLCPDNPFVLTNILSQRTLCPDEKIFPGEHFVPNERRKKKTRTRKRAHTLTTHTRIRTHTHTGVRRDEVFAGMNPSSRLSVLYCRGVTYFRLARDCVCKFSKNCQNYENCQNIEEIVLRRIVVPPRY